MKLNGEESGSEPILDQRKLAIAKTEIDVLPLASYLHDHDGSSEQTPIEAAVKSRF